MKVGLLFTAILTWILTLSIHESESFRIRLWPTNEEGTEGFVEAYRNGTWGYIGSPSFEFSETTANTLCRILGISEFGFGEVWAPMGNYVMHSWLLTKIRCHGNETNAEQCELSDDLKEKEHARSLVWLYTLGSKLHCYDSRLVVDEWSNSGVLLSTFNGEVYKICSDGFDMNSAQVACQSLGYEKALSFKGTKIDTVKNRVHKRRISCNGNESALSKCNRQKVLLKCSRVVSIACQAVRFKNLNQYKDEGVPELFHQGTWGYLGIHGSNMDDTTAGYLCNIFGFGNVGFSVHWHDLRMYDNIGWSASIKCLGNETNAMQCLDHLLYAAVPSVRHTYRVGPWLYCFPYVIDSVRLSDGVDQHEGRIELRINGRWGSICPYKMEFSHRRMVGRVICRQLGYVDIAEVLLGEDKPQKEDLYWMNHVLCKGDETDISQCVYERGSSQKCHIYPRIRVRCRRVLFH